MAYQFETGAFIGVASGVALLVLAALVALLRPRTIASVSFAVAAALWGAAVAAANMSLLAADPATAYPWVRALVILYIPLHVPVLLLASSHPRPSNRLARSAPLRALFVLPSLALVALAILAPGLFVEAVVLNDEGLPSTVGGPLFAPVIYLNSVLAFVAALWLFLPRLRTARTATQRSQLALLVAALLVYVAYRAAPLPWVLLEADLLVAEQGAVYAVVAVFGTAAALAGTAWAALLVARDRGMPWRRLLLVSWVVPVVVGLAEQAATRAAWPSFVTASFTVGLWRLAAVALLAYAIARFRLFDLDLRVKTAARRSTVAGIVVAGFFVVTELIESLLGVEGALPSLVAAALIALALHPLRLAIGRAADHLFFRASGPEYLAGRKYEVYRGALEGATLDGVITARERGLLDRLARELGIPGKQAAALEREVLSAFGG